MILSKAATEIIKRLNDASFEAYAVGGAVRDLIMGKVPKDFDVATSAKTDDIKAVFSDSVIITTGEKHGTVTVLCGGEPIEITTFRKDGAYLDSRHPSEVKFVDDITEDLRRRDFTINAIAYNEEVGIVDPFGGLSDIQGGQIRAVGDPYDRFREDALRIMRCIRFASVLGFRIEDGTEHALKENYFLLDNISVERIFSELKLFLSGDFRRLLQSHLYIFEFLFPNWVMPKNLCIDDGDDTVTRLAYFFSGCGEEMADEYLRKLKSDTKTRKDVIRVLNAIKRDIRSKRDALLLLSEFGFEDARRAIGLRSACGESEFFLDACGGCYSTSQLDISGRELLELGFRGEAVGKAMKMLLSAVIDDEVINEKSELGRYLVHKIESGHILITKEIKRS